MKLLLTGHLEHVQEVLVNMVGQSLHTFDSQTVPAVLILKVRGYAVSFRVRFADSSNILGVQLEIKLLTQQLGRGKSKSVEVSEQLLLAISVIQVLLPTTLVPKLSSSPPGDLIRQTSSQ